MGNIFNHPTKVTLRESDHRYFDQHGEEYLSQSKFVGIFKNEFDAEMISARSAAAEIKKAGGEVTTETVMKLAKEKKDSWLAIGEESSDHGTYVHNNLEWYGKGLTSKVHPSFDKLCVEYYADLLDKHRWYNEQIFFLEKEKIAGTADLPIQRTNSMRSVLDIDDTKTNNRKGIVFFDKYKKWMKFPLTHLEDCNYNHYALQLSLYGYMAQVTHGIRPGMLRIRFIDAQIEGKILKSYKITNIPVPYMYYEIEAMIEYYMAMKSQKVTQHEDESEAIEP